MFGVGHDNTSTVDAEYASYVETVKQTFRRSHAQQTALNQIVVDVVWSSDARQSKDDSDQTYNDTFDVQQFMTTLLEHLMLCGYALFRLRHGMPEFADTALYYLETNGCRWRPRVLPGGKTMLSGTRWHLVLLDAPIAEMRPNPKSRARGMWVTLRPSSAASRAMLHSLALDELILHRRQRNLYNSQPTMFMHEYRDTPIVEEKHRGDMSWRSKYLYEFEGAPTAATTTGATATAIQPVEKRSYQQLLQERLNRTHLLRQSDQIVQAEQVQSGNAVGSVPVVPGGLEPARPPGRQAHAELLLSSGLDHTVSRHLEGDAHEAVVRIFVASLKIDLFYL